MNTSLAVWPLRIPFHKLYPAILVCLLANVSPTIGQPLWAQTKTLATEPSMQPINMLPDAPVGITSFGAASCDGHLYVYGGHVGNAHEYYRQGQNGTTWRLNLENPVAWESVSESGGRQGLAMVAHGGKVYRLGGFEARNSQGDPQDLHSLASVDVLDPAVGSWQEYKPMPVPRSSFDAVVVRDTLYVIGGWAMSGGEEKQWLTSAYSLDLSNPQADWQTLPSPPFVRRALSAAFQNDKIYVIGGMQEKGGPTRQVAVFDLATGQWTGGPELPGDDPMEGFGSSSFNVGGRVVVSTFGGNVFELNADGDGWLPLGSIQPGRFFHRLLPVSESGFALIGGANMQSGKTLDTPVFAR